MKLRYIKNLFSVAALACTLGLSSCISDLDVTPIDPNVHMTFEQDKVFNKIYGTLALTGQEGPSGDGDIEDIDEGTSAFFRMGWIFNELTTDEAIVNSWTDAGLSDVTACTWGASNVMSAGLYYRLTFDVTLCNFFLEQTAGASDSETIRQRAEVRFIRALNYFYLMDFFANPPIMDKVTTEKPQQYTRTDLFTHIEKELKEIDTDLAEPRTNTYGRVDKVAAWLLLARMYLNAEVYTGEPQWSLAHQYAQQVLGSNYELCPTYAHLFMADNGGEYDGSSVNKAPQEVILPIYQDGSKTQSYGGSFFLIAGTHNAGMPNWGSTDGWAGPHCRQSMVEKFFPNGNAPLEADEATIIEAAKDDRAMMYSIGCSLSTNNNTAFTDGFSCTKFTNVRADGGNVNDSKFTDTDIPFMRLAEAYLTLAEASIRMNGGQSTKEATDAINELRIRAHATQKSSYTLTDIRDEWAREFWFEGRRRMDLIRFGNYGGTHTYNWDWKGGVKDGQTIQEYRNILPIPAQDLNANSNLKQNPKY